MPDAHLPFYLLLLGRGPETIFWPHEKKSPGAFWKEAREEKCPRPACEHSYKEQQCPELDLYTRGTVTSTSRVTRAWAMDDGGRPCSVPCSPEHPEGHGILSAKMEMTQNEHGRRGAKAPCPRQPQATLKDRQSCPPCAPGTVLTAARGLHRRLQA